MTQHRLHLIMGLQCNARCIMCYQQDFSSKYNMPPEIYREHLKPILPQIKSVKLQGGEPTIMSNCKDFCEFTNHIPEMKINLTTNGLYMNDFWLDTLSQRGSTVNVSLNAATKATYDQIVKHGNFSKAMKNTNKLVGKVNHNKTKISLSMVVLPQNILELADFIKLSIELGVHGVIFIIDPVLSFASLPPRERMHEVLDEALSIPTPPSFHLEGLPLIARRFADAGNHVTPGEMPSRCNMPFSNFVVDEKGDIRICCATWRIMGNTYKDNINEIVNGPEIKEFQNKVRKNNYIWCDPTCPDNPNPHKLAQINKYYYLIKNDPLNFMNKVRNKLEGRTKVKSS